MTFFRGLLIALPAGIAMWCAIGFIAWLVVS
jgi:hypothetical protein